DLHHVKMLAGRKTFVHGCPRCEAEAADETEDRIIGPCPECGAGGGSESHRAGNGDSDGDGDGDADADTDSGELAIKRLRAGSRLVGCTRYPDCEYSLPLPRRGEVDVTEETCEEHGLPHLRIVEEGDDDPWDLGCPICNYREYEARQAGSELETIDGIGEATAEKLEAAGVVDVETLKEIEPDALAEEVDGVGAETVRNWQAQAD
ncbi:MAG: helix-hairpin-helix domain-containing protein, partial [Haloferacaceae archaeon]